VRGAGTVPPVPGARITTAIGWVVIGLVGLGITLAGCERRGSDAPVGDAVRMAPPAESAAAAEASAPAYVGAARCVGCHATQAESWRGSHHDRAMQEASEDTVLGDFADARFTHQGSTSRFFRRDGRFLVDTSGSDGRPADFEIAYTFGVEPLQQYLVRFPDGKVQALGVAWDSRPRAGGGERWFSLHPGERVPPGDVLHWTAPSQNWNGRCADCHSTNLLPGYDLEQDAYHTTWSDLDVACEACHGPGSRHVEWAEAAAHGAAGADDLGLAVRFPRRVTWVLDRGARIAHRAEPLPAHTELETCAPCHARRSTLVEGGFAGAPFLDTHRPALLEEGLYEADGQIRDEVYEYGSFVQSRMHAAGVTCSDCHEPHSLARRAEGNTLCGTCHRPEAFDVAAHHHHPAGTAGAACVSCHMPARTYMGVDVRHDHSFRVPRPDLSVSLGTPNACTDCHRDRDARWAAEAVTRWFPGGRAGTPHFAEALDAGRRGLPGAERKLAHVAGDAAQAAIVRASALALLAGYGDPGSLDAVRRALSDPDPLVRLGALEAAAALEPGARLAAVAPLLRDPRRAVRIEAARVLAEVPPSLWAPADRAALADGLAEYRAVQETAADRPEAHVNLGLLHLVLGEPEAARGEYETAVRLAPWFVPTYVNLADLERTQGRDAAGEAWLRRGLAAVPDSPDLHHAFGLALVRLGRREEALAALARAAESETAQPRHAYAHGLALYDAGDVERALAVLRAAHERRPGDRDLLVALATLSADAGRSADAVAFARALVDAFPDDPQARALLQQMEGVRP
jgi:tetratricopeptide (TPR) repeat protein